MSGISEFGVSQLQAWLRIQPSARPKIYRDVFRMADMASLSYWLEIFFSAGIATFGLVESSPAVIIGAMLISPLMGPIMATGLALAIGDLYLGAKAVLNLLASISASVAFSGLLVWLLPFHAATPEILARTNPNLLDLGIALLSGLAGSVVVSRASDDGATALPGVAIAVALMPPLCVIGFGLGSNVNLDIMGGAGLLFLTNLVAIVASAFLVFLLVGMGTPEVQEEMIAAREHEPSRLAHRRFAGVLAARGQLRWRVLMVVVLLAAIAVPLGRALVQLANEAVARTAVQDELKRLVPADSVVSQQVTVGPSDIIIRVVSTKRLSDQKVTQAREDLMRRTGHNVQLSVEAVASTNELTELMARLRQAPPEPVVKAPPEKTVEEIRKQLLSKVGSAVQEIWPSADAPIQDLSLVLDASGVTAVIRYQANKDLDAVVTGIVLRSLQMKLNLPGLQLKTERVGSPGAQITKRSTRNAH